MSRIMLMKPELANLIAAGEVIERPSSVIKELVENSIDAGARNIYIGVSHGGKGSIIVKDDGSGMDREDAKNCFLRHASSKVKSEYDLTRIRTLGFRGEALPSIAAVSHVELVTATEEGAGTRVKSEPNAPLIIEDAPSRKGTIFEVKNLFFNTPARLKYLKSDQVETYSIIETCEHLSLGFPGISFSLFIDDKEIFRTSGRGDLLECIQKIYGNQIAKSLYPVRFEGIAYSFSGFIAKPEINYSKRKEMLTFLNHRAIYSYKLNKAIESAYQDYLPVNRYPFVAIDFDIDSSLVDVNVHPTKKEVRISLEDDIGRDLKEQISLTLSQKKPIYQMAEDPKANDMLTPFDVEDLKEEEREVQNKEQDPLLPPSENSGVLFQDSIPFEEGYESKAMYSSNETIPAVRERVQQVPMVSYSPDDYYASIFRNEGYSHKLPEMHPLGQVLDTYIICEGDACFYLIDQHAAEERINFEKTECLFAQIKSRDVPLFPLTLELTPKERANLDEEHLHTLEGVGIVLEPFGEGVVKAVEIPSFLNDKNRETYISDCVHQCLNDEHVNPLSLLHLTIANIACKMSLKANQKLSLLEMEALIRDLAKCKNPANCPHGRPTLIKVTKEDIEKLFRRTGF